MGDPTVAEQFRIDIPQAGLDDLRGRSRGDRWGG
jgi:hypothetical protein